MRWGIFCDIHANLEALDAVLAALAGERIDRYLCLGDIVGYGANPRECIAEIKKIDAPTIAGNHDWAAVGLFDIAYFNPAAKAAVLWTRQNLAYEDKEFLKNLDLIHREEELTLVHASLQNPGQFEYILDISSAARTFELLRTRLCFIGHSHAPLIFIKEGENYSFTFQAKVKLKASRMYIINAGSVGQPRDADPRASYVVYDSESEDVEIKRVPYDVQKAQEKIIKAGLPTTLAERLAAGR
ncbi:metallophosphatase family protein [bacterium]|nr:metallophosphatase family protein [Candidatus Omnitrophota bacterium]MBU4141156.1 metallophosphatase family protein [Candidatus Omnitrophota bacterium]MCG2677775.1 metallophosphatase family protein [bacterium]